MALARLTLRRAAVLTAALAALTVAPAASAATLQIEHSSTSATDTGPSANGLIAGGDTIDIDETVLSSEIATLTNLNGNLSIASGATVTQANAPYPDLSFGATGTNTIPFTATVPAAHPCGANLPFVLSIGNASGSANIPVTVGTGAAGPPVTYQSSDVPHPIPDGGTLSTTFNVEQTGRIKDISVRLGEIRHPYVSDLRITLVAPDGTSVVLVDRVGGDGDDFVGTVIGSHGPSIQGVSAGQAPFTGTFHSAENLSALVGHSTEGTWSLDIQDTTFGDFGTLKAWGADISPATCAARPVASFSATPNPVLPGGTVDFDASESVDPSGTITNYEWDLDGDGTFETDTGSTPTVSHVYPVRASVPVGLRITDDQAATDVTTRTIAVTDGPTAAFTATPLAPVSGTPVDLDASASSDVDGTVVHYEWDLDGNGTYETDAGTDSTISHSFPNPGTINVKLRVTDDNGATDVETHDVVVSNRVPVASFTRPTPAVSGTPASFDASGSSDPDGTVDRYEWDLDGNGTYETDTGPVATVQRTYTGAQTLNVGLRVTDDLGATTTTSLQLRVTGPPVAAIAIVGPSTVKPNQTVTFDASGSSDSDGTIAKYEWDFDGNGTFETDGGDKDTASHAFQLGTFQVGVRVTDNDGATATATVTLTVANALPVPTLVVPAGGATTGVPALLDASGSSDPDGTIVKYDWDLDGNGTFETTTGSVATVSYAYPNAGSITVRVLVTDDSGATAAKAATLTIASAPATGGGGSGTGGTGTGTGGTAGGSTSGAGTGTGADTGSGTGAGAGGGTDGGAAGPVGPFSAGLIGAPIQALKLARTRGVGVTCTADRKATCDVILELPGAEAKRLKLVKVKKGKKAKALKVGSAKVTAGPGSGTKMVLRLNARLKRALKKTRRVQLVLRGTATDGAGGKIALARIVLLRR